MRQSVTITFLSFGLYIVVTCLTRKEALNQNTLRIKDTKEKSNIIFLSKFCGKDLSRLNSLRDSMDNTNPVDEKAHPRWQSMWGNLPPGAYFDAMSPSPALLKFINDGVIPSGRCLVPGCGRGYDVNALAKQADRVVLGIDIAENAIQAAWDWYHSVPSDERAPLSNVDFKSINFFDLSIEEKDTFDFIYDYTFLCALNPSLREAWGRQMANLTKPGGVLMTLIFPIRSLDITGGPPYTVSLDIVKNILESVGFEEIVLEMLPPELCHRNRDGSTGMSSGVGLWRRR